MDLRSIRGTNSEGSTLRKKRSCRFIIFLLNKREYIGDKTDLNVIKIDNQC